jgi:hypothetical protein
VTAENDHRLHALISIIWNHVYKLTGNDLSQNADEIMFNLGCQHFTDTVAGLHGFYIRHNFSSYVSGSTNSGSNGYSNTIKQPDI